jgi:hypothetical protein
MRTMDRVAPEVEKPEHAGARSGSKALLLIPTALAALSLLLWTCTPQANCQRCAVAQQLDATGTGQVMAAVLSVLTYLGLLVCWAAGRRLRSVAIWPLFIVVLAAKTALDTIALTR